MLTLLAVDGVISAVLAAFFLPLRLGSVPFPISALISGLLNAALVWAALQWTSSPRLAALPLWTWLDGSSRSSTDGSIMSARPIATIWRSPPDSALALTRRRSDSSGNNSLTNANRSANFFRRR